MNQLTKNDEKERWGFAAVERDREMDLSHGGQQQDEKAAPIGSGPPVPYGAAAALGSLPSVALSSVAASEAYPQCRRPQSDKSIPTRVPQEPGDDDQRCNAPDRPYEPPLSARSLDWVSVNRLRRTNRPLCTGGKPAGCQPCTDSRQRIAAFQSERTWRWRFADGHRL